MKAYHLLGCFFRALKVWLLTMFTGTFCNEFTEFSTQALFNSVQLLLVVLALTMPVFIMTGLGILFCGLIKPRIWKVLALLVTTFLINLATHSMYRDKFGNPVSMDKFLIPFSIASIVFMLFINRDWLRQSVTYQRAS